MQYLCIAVPLEMTEVGGGGGAFPVASAMFFTYGAAAFTLTR